MPSRQIFEMVQWRLRELWSIHQSTHRRYERGRWIGGWHHTEHGPGVGVEVTPRPHDKHACKQCKAEKRRDSEGEGSVPVGVPILVRMRRVWIRLHQIR